MCVKSFENYNCILNEIKSRKEYNAKDGTPLYDYIDICITKPSTIENAEKNCKKGDTVEVEGSVETYTKKIGESTSKQTVIKVEKIKKIGEN